MVEIPFICTINFGLMTLIKYIKLLALKQYMKNLQKFLKNSVNSHLKFQMKRPPFWKSYSQLQAALAGQ